jgi:hypothetical protein
MLLFSIYISIQLKAKASTLSSLLFKCTAFYQVTYIHWPNFENTTTVNETHMIYLYLLYGIAL